MRALFMQSIPWRQLLFREGLRAHSRRDFAPDADAEACARVAKLVADLGPLPAAVLTGDQVPRHTRRRVQLSEEELNLLKEAALALDDGAAEEAQGLL